METQLAGAEPEPGGALRRLALLGVGGDVAEDRDPQARRVEDGARSEPRRAAPRGAVEHVGGEPGEPRLGDPLRQRVGGPVEVALGQRRGGEPHAVEHRHLGATGDGAAAIEAQRGALAPGGKAVHRVRERAGRFEPAVQPGGAEDAEEQAVTAGNRQRCELDPVDPEDGVLRHLGHDPPVRGDDVKRVELVPREIFLQQLPDPLPAIVDHRGVAPPSSSPPRRSDGDC